MRRKMWQGLLGVLTFQARCISSSGLSKLALLEYIRKNTVISTQHLTPEIGLHLITPECKLWQARPEESLVSDPFWAFYWPGGQALTRYILDNRSLVSGQNVVDVGSGCGASAIAAKMMGAKHVIANDICEVAAVALEMNLSLNQSSVEVSCDNLVGQDNPDWDTVFLGDMFYDEAFTNTVYDWLKNLNSNGTQILLGDPGRVFLMNHPMRKNLVLLARYDLPQHTTLENNGFSQGFVWKFCQ